MIAVLYAFIILAVLGLALGLGLAFADKKLSVKKDEKLISLEEIMPGANCGGCGFAGCSAYAEAVYSGQAQPGLCMPGGNELAAKMGQIMGVEVQSQERQVAYVFCKGNCSNTKKEYDYKGLDDCNAASILFNGDNLCKEGCLHLGSCIKVCDNGAISKDENGNIVVDSSKCVGCGKCVKVCPHGVIKLIPESLKFVVPCNNHEKGPEVRKKCEVGCIGCKICEVKFPGSGFVVNDNLAQYTRNNNVKNAESALQACPRKIITER